MTLDILKEKLFSNPFDSALRRKYIDALIEAKVYQDALGQITIMIDQNINDEDLLAQRELCLNELSKNKEISAQDKNILNLVKGNSSAEDPAAGKVIPFKTDISGKVYFKDIAGMEEVKRTLRLQVIEPYLNPGLFAKFRKKAGGGTLLYGPPGCGKTMMAKAIASECGLSFFSVAISDILNMWVGQSEGNLAGMFEKARSQAPCLMFFDELDALAFSRSKSRSEHSRTLVNEFLSQLDGFEQGNEQILFLAATNMPWDIDPAMKRPGRFSKIIFVPPPDQEAQEEMLKLKLKDVPCQDINFREIAIKLRFFSGADIDGLIDYAKEAALSEIISSGQERPLMMRDFMGVIDEINPSTSNWLRTVRNIVTHGGADKSYKAVEVYLKKSGFR